MRGLLKCSFISFAHSLLSDSLAASGVFWDIVVKVLPNLTKTNAEHALPPSYSSFTPSLDALFISVWKELLAVCRSLLYVSTLGTWKDSVFFAVKLWQCD